MSRKQENTTEHAGLRIVNIPESLARLGGDQSLLLELVEIFLEDVPGLMKEIEVAVAAGNSATYASLAHRIKGLASNFSAHPCTTAAWELEKRGRGHNETDPARLFEDLKTETSAVQIELERFRDSSSV